ncbi:PAS domain S-box-containing protein [Halopiger aswanensis]|uniref:histidine kinase n=1 Tax=Halopiger aswanensis TaxID=148449 RepID=A0A3R7EE29_9EURY|nr:PAS domain S-box-containing protein [Halopiger aswanensis]
MTDDGVPPSAEQPAADSLESPPSPFDAGDFFRQLVANTSEGLLTIDEHSRILFANPAIEEILGYEPAELIGESKMVLIPERLRPAHAAGLEKYLRTGEKHIDWGGIELPALHKDGHEVPVLVSLREHSYEGQRIFTGLFRDISDRKERQRRFEAVFNNTYQLTGLLEPDGTILEVNRTALEFAGVERGEVVGNPLWEAPCFAANEAGRTVARTGVDRASDGDFFRDELRVRGENRTAVIDFSIRPIDHDGGAPQLLVVEGRDVTALKRRERHLQVLHRLLRHNLRNDLNAIHGFAELLLEELECEVDGESADGEADANSPPVDRTDDLCAYVAEIAATATELIETNETAKELAAATLGGEQPREPVVLEDVLAEVIADLRDQYPESVISVTDRTESAGPTIAAADSRLQTVLEEVIDNAVRHTDERPEIEVDVATAETDIAIRVIDNGPGIPEPERTGIFNEEPITQLDHGNGLGLWLVGLVLEEYGGDLEYESGVDGTGGGSCVTIRVPRATDDEDGWNGGDDGREETRTRD